MGLVRQGLGILALIGVLCVSGAALAAPGDKLADKGKIDQVPAVTADFGDDASQYANDGECDDPRFSGAGSAKRPAGVDRGHDATDCEAALTAGSVAFNGEPVLPAIDFGDDSSSYANNSECDDPRFEGSTGMASVLVNGDIMHDAADCRTLVEAGTITVIPVFSPAYAAGAPYDASSITFGNDTSSYANNVDCDDPRFLGPGSASSLLDEDLLHDATDCQAAFEAGTVILKADAEANPDIDFNVYTSDKDPSIVFGDNNGEYADNGECDDPRFEGEGVVDVLNNEDNGKDAKDCRDLFDAGTITLLAVYGPDYVTGAPYDSTGVSFGDNTSDYANNSECDDPRFIGPGVASVLLDEDTMRDGEDCTAAFEGGTIVLRAGAEPNPVIDTTVYTSTNDPTIDFGDNTSDYKNNGECDDPRFAGEGAADTLLDSDKLHDAKDCSELFDAGTVTLIAVFHPDYANGAPYDSAGIDFGDDTSSYANNSECDDPRFEGPGMASVVLDEDTSRDAADCKTLLEAGTVALKGAAAPTPTVNGNIDFGDDTSDYANDTECDDPRFFGEGSADVLVNNDLMHDATDCRAAVEAGTVAMLPVFGPDYVNGAPYDTAAVDFGDNTSDYKDNGECDDPRFVGPGMASVLADEDTSHDAADCTGKFTAGLVALKGDTAGAPTTPENNPPPTEDNPPAPQTGDVDFGDDTSDYANNNTCDDMRFAGEGMDTVLLQDDIGHDATDCRTLVDAGKLAFQQVFAPDYVRGAPFATTGVDFGDNTSDYKDNDECDDPRFVGPGMAVVVSDDDISHDAADCEAKFVAGLVALKG